MELIIYLHIVIAIWNRWVVRILELSMIYSVYRQFIKQITIDSKTKVKTIRTLES